MFMSMHKGGAMTDRRRDFVGFKVPEADPDQIRMQELTAAQVVKSSSMPPDYKYLDKS
jgi:hypothetical protein